MTGAFLLGALPWLAAAAACQQPGPAPIDTPPVAIRWQVPHRPWFAGEAFHCAVVLEVDAAFRAERLQPVFLRQLDLPVDVTLGAATGGRWERLPLAEDARPRASLALDDEQATASQLPIPEQPGPGDAGGTDILRYTIPLLIRVLPDATALELPAPAVRVAWAEGFTEDLIRGRVPTAVQQATVRGDPVQGEVQPLPPGAPPSFTGAIGVYSFHFTYVTMGGDAPGARTEVQASVSGRGNLGAFGAPIWEPGEDYVLQGRSAEPLRLDDTGGMQAWQWDVVAPNGLHSDLNPMEFAWFDPEREDYVAVGFPIRRDPVAGIRSWFDRFTGVSAVVRYTVAGLLGLAFGAGAGLWWRRRRRRKPATTPLRELFEAWDGDGRIGPERLAVADATDLHERWTEAMAALQQTLGGDGAEVPAAAALKRYGVDPEQRDRIAAAGNTIRALRFQPEPDPEQVARMAREAQDLLVALVIGPLGGERPR